MRDVEIAALYLCGDDAVADGGKFFGQFRFVDRFGASADWISDEIGRGEAVFCGRLACWV